MNLSIDRKALHAGLAAVGRAISGRSSLPILSNVALEANGDGDCCLFLRATDLELAIETQVPYVARQAGSITLPARTLQEIIAALPEGTVTLQTDKNDAGTITCGRSHFRIHGLPATEFPPVPQIDEGLRFTIGEGALHRLISYVIAAVSRDDTRPVLTGALFDCQGNGLTLAATDTHRLCVAKGAIAIDTAFDIPAPIVPGRALHELCRLLDEKSTETVACDFGTNQARFAVAGTVLTTRLIEGAFPKYQRVIPTSHAIRLTVATDEFRRAVKRAAVVARDDANRLTLCAVNSGELTISASAGETGSCREEMEIGWGSGKGCTLQEIRVCLNTEYLLQSIDALGTETFSLGVTHPLEPMTLLPAGAEGFTAVIMPMNAGG